MAREKAFRWVCRTCKQRGECDTRDECFVCGCEDPKGSAAELLPDGTLNIFTHGLDPVPVAN